MENSFYLSTPSGERVYFHRDIVIERKASLEELSGNLAQEREAFEKEFLRARNDRAKVYLMVEDKGGYSSIIEINYSISTSLNLFRGRIYHVKLYPIWEALCIRKAEFNV